MLDKNSLINLWIKFQLGRHLCFITILRKIIFKIPNCLKIKKKKSDPHLKVQGWAKIRQLICKHLKQIERITKEKKRVLKCIQRTFYCMLRSYYNNLYSKRRHIHQKYCLRMFLQTHCIVAGSVLKLSIS